MPSPGSTVPVWPACSSDGARGSRAPGHPGGNRVPVRTVPRGPQARLQAVDRLRAGHRGQDLQRQDHRPVPSAGTGGATGPGGGELPLTPDRSLRLRGADPGAVRRRGRGRADPAGQGRPRRIQARLMDRFTVDTTGRLVTDITDRVADHAGREGADGILHVFVPHATAGVALMETGSGAEGDLEEALERLLPRDDRYAHRHGSVGHGGDHLLPAFVSPSLVLAVEGGSLVLGTWQRVVIVDPNRENDRRRMRLSFLAG